MGRGKRLEPLGTSAVLGASTVGAALVGTSSVGPTIMMPMTGAGTVGTGEPDARPGTSTVVGTSTVGEGEIAGVGVAEGRGVKVAWGEGRVGEGAAVGSPDPSVQPARKSTKSIDRKHSFLINPPPIGEL